MSRHYQMYPFTNVGHFALYPLVDKKAKAELAGYYRSGIEKIIARGKTNPYGVGVPFLWCSNNLVVAYILPRLRQLGWSENSSLFASAVLRGSYHLYQGLGGGFGNVVMGLVFGRYWQRTGRLWPLVIAHALIDTVAFVGYQALRGHVSWLP